MSVVIPARNAAGFIRPAIESALMQDVDDLEVVVVENCSSDTTYDEACALAGPRVRIVRQASMVPIDENWSRATLEATGDFIRLLCADDLLEPGVLRRQLDHLERSPQAVAVVGPRRIIDDTGKELFARRGGSGLAPVQTGREALRAAVLAGTNVFGEPSAVLFRAAPLRRCLPWSARFPYMLDLEMYARVFQLGEVVYDPHVAASFRVHTGSWSLDLGRQQADDYNHWASWILEAGMIDARFGDRLRGLLAARLNQAARGLVYRFRVPAAAGSGSDQGSDVS